MVPEIEDMFKMFNETTSLVGARAPWKSKIYSTRIGELTDFIVELSFTTDNGIELIIRKTT